MMLKTKKWAVLYMNTIGRIYPTLNNNIETGREVVCKNDKYIVRESIMNSMHVINKQKYLAEELLPDDDQNK